MYPYRSVTATKETPFFCILHMHNTFAYDFPGMVAADKQSLEVCVNALKVIPSRSENLMESSWSDSDGCLVWNYIHRDAHLVHNLRWWSSN